MNTFPKTLTKDIVCGFSCLLGGSTHPHEGYIDGRHYVLKCGSYSDLSSDEHVHNEYIADTILRIAGCNVPKSQEYFADIGHNKKEIIRLSEFIENGRHLYVAAQQANGAELDYLILQIVETYPVIAFVDGTDTYQHHHLDNVLVDKDYNLWFIDNGASFDFRARGSRKGWFWQRTSVFDPCHGYYCIRENADNSLKKIISSVANDDLRKAAQKYDFEQLVEGLPLEYQKSSLVQYAKELNLWSKGGLKTMNTVTSLYAAENISQKDSDWLVDISLTIAKAVRRINKFIDKNKAHKTASSNTMAIYNANVDMKRLQKLSLVDATGRAEKLLSVCDAIANSAAAGYSVMVLADKWHPNDPSLQRPGKMGNVDFSEYEFVPNTNINHPSQNNLNIEIVLGDIAQTKADAIVNAANSVYIGGGGIDGAIHYAAGPALAKECEKFPRNAKGEWCPTGEARTTKAYKLPAKYVIHTAGPDCRMVGMNVAPTLLANCYKSVLQAAIDSGCKSIAIPSISTGIFEFPLDDAIKIAVKETKQFLQCHPSLTVKFVVWNGHSAGATKAKYLNEIATI